MSVTFTQAVNTLAEIANVLADEATKANNNALSTALENFAGEIASSLTQTTPITEDEFFSGSTTTNNVGITWSNILVSAANAIRATADNTQASVVENVNTSCTSGPHIKMAGGGCAGDGASNQYGRAMMMLNLKATGKLEEFKEELSNPTPLE